MRYRQENGSLDGLRMSADALSLARIPAAELARRQLRGKRRDPEDRTWGFAAGVATLLLTDKLDGTLARKAQARKGGDKDSFGGWLDQLSDKVVCDMLMSQLAKNDEISPDLVNINRVRDVAVTAGRIAMESNGLDASAGKLGKIKTLVNSVATVMACSPIQAQHPELTEGLFQAATVMSVVSGVEYLSQVMPLLLSPSKENVEDLVYVTNSLIESHQEQFALAA
jgi:phosphatidylglycerophosphate synthase